MANKNMTFSASLRLNSKQFQKGIADVQRSIKSLQSSFLSLAGALGIGLSINRLGSEFMDTAVKLSTAQNVLKNVSKELGEYGENIVWLKKISNDYGQDLITLTNSFAQFRAAAASSSLSLEQMREIYESLARASGAYHLSADQTNGVMLAVTQMLSKGRVASEELRKQLGERLPGAFALMAQAAYNAGVITENSTSALEEAMKKGKVMAVDVLPSFAKVLNDVTENANFESLQTSITRMKNTFTELVEGANFEGMYQKLVDGANSTLKFFTDSFWPKVLGIGAGIFGGTAIAKGMRNMSSQMRSEAGSMAKQLEVLKASHTKFRADIINNYDAILNKMRAAGNQGRTYFGLDSYDKSKAYVPLKDGGVGPKVDRDYLKAASAAREYNQQLLDMDKLSRRLYGRRLISKEDAREIASINKQFDGLLNSFRSGVQETSRFAGVTQVLTNLWKSSIAVAKTALTSLAIGAIIGGITYLVSKLIEARKEAKRIAGIADEMKTAVEGVSGAENETVVKLTQIKSALQQIDDKTPDDFKQGLINNVNKLLGRTGDALLTIKDDITDKVIPAIDEYINKIIEAARQQAILAQISSATSRIIQLGVENEKTQSDPNYGKKEHYQTGSIYSPLGGAVSQTELLTTEAQKLQAKVDKNNKEIGELNKGIETLKKMATKETIAALTGSETSGTTGGGGGGGGKTEKGTPNAVITQYKQDIRELENQFKAGAIMAADYEEKLKKLNSKAFEDLAAFGWEKVESDLKKGDLGIAEGIRAAAQKALLEGLNDPAAVEEFDKEMQEAADKALKDFQDAWNRYLRYIKQKPLSEAVEAPDYALKSNKRGKGQSFSERESYLNSQVLDATNKDISNLETFKKQLEDALKTEADPKNIERIKDLLDNIIERLNLLKISAKDLKAKADIATLEKELADLKEKSIDGIFSSITTISNGMDNLYRAYQSLQQMNDSTWKSEELEKFLTGLNSLIQLLEVIKGVYTAVNAVIKVSDAIREKSAAKAILLNKMEAKSEIEKGVAAGGAAAAGGASSVASIPIVGPALAVAAVAAIVAAIMAGMSKFATGGIVGGAKSGDKNVIRANGGEAILTTSQQKRLLAIADGKGGIGGQTTFKIKGCDLVSVLNNEMSRRKG